MQVKIPESETDNDSQPDHQEVVGRVRPVIPPPTNTHRRVQKNNRQEEQ